MKKEIWLPIAGFEGLYEVSNWGRVKSLARIVIRKDGKRLPVPEKILTPYPNCWGYLQVNLYKDEKPTTVSVHILVWDAFVGKDRTGLQVNHIDEDKNNNAVWNLNLMTPKENANYGTRNERIAKARNKAVIAQDPITLKVAYEFPSTQEAKRKGFHQGAVSAACRGCFNREGNHIYKGYFWRWAT